jgi:A/G-specific adenine glycosylase
MTSDPRAFAPWILALLDWYAEHGRQLVIRATRDPYPIWVGEVMSQQTRIGRVGTALPPFLDRFPSIPDLAAASTADVIRAWGGLGYPRRAVALRDAARVMVERHAGEVPRTIDELEALPGIGPYTARAVAATAFGIPVTALDVNARRVLGRALDGAPLPGPVSPRGLARADALAPVGRAAEWNHALMDLGASICGADPDCAACPIRRWCAYAMDGSRPMMPARLTPAATPFRETNRYVRGRVLAALRDSPAGAWVEIDPQVLSIAAARLERAVGELAAEGLVEVREDVRAPWGARLANG